MTRTIKQVEADIEVTKLEQTVYFVGGLVVAILSFRLIMRLFGVIGNGFSRFIYEVSAPLVWPLHKLTGREPDFAEATLEPTTILAAAVYLGIGYLVLRVAEIRRQRAE